MNYALLLAGGIGSRMKTPGGIPKQFLTIDDKPIIIYTIEKLKACKKIDKIVVVCNPRYMTYISDLLSDYDLEDIPVTGGGGSRLESVLNGLNFIKSLYKYGEKDVFLAIDAVRPLVSDRILEENIDKASDTGASTTVLPLQETILLANESDEITSAMSREGAYSGQSPDAFNINYFMECTGKIDPEELKGFTSLTENITHAGGKVSTVIGEKENIKITTPFDLALAKSILEKK